MIGPLALFEKKMSKGRAGPHQRSFSTSFLCHGMNQSRDSSSHLATNILHSEVVNNNNNNKAQGKIFASIDVFLGLEVGRAPSRVLSSLLCTPVVAFLSPSRRAFSFSKSADIYFAARYAASSQRGILLLFGAEAEEGNLDQAVTKGQLIIFQ